MTTKELKHEITEVLLPGEEIEIPARQLPDVIQLLKRLENDLRYKYTLVKNFTRVRKELR